MRRQLVASAAIVGTFGIVLAIGMVLTRSDSEPSSDAAGSRDPERPALCVELAGSAVDAGVSAEEVVAALDGALDTVSGGTPPENTIMDYGCPSDAEIDCGMGYARLVVLCDDNMTNVSSPGFYHAHVFVATQAEFDLMTGRDLGDYQGRHATREIIWSGDSGHEVTGAIYMSLDELFDAEAAVKVLREGMGLDEAPTPQPAIGGLSHDRLIWTTRERLALCVELAPNADLPAEAARSAVEDAMRALVMSDPYWGNLGARANPPLVESGCPRAPVFTCDSGGAPVECLWADFRVLEPSKFLVFVFLVSNDDIDDIVGDAGTRTGVIEHTCQSSQCDDVTRSLYLTAEELQDPVEIAHLLSIATAPFASPR